MTFGNAKAIDLLAYNDETGRTFSIQVKALRKRTYFLLGHKRVKPEHMYVFVLLNAPGRAVDYFIVPGAVLSAEPKRFSRWFLAKKMPGIHPKTLEEQGFREAWHHFHERGSAKNSSRKHRASARS